MNDDIPIRDREIEKDRENKTDRENKLKKLEDKVKKRSKDFI